MMYLCLVQGVWPARIRCPFSVQESTRGGQSFRMTRDYNASCHLNSKQQTCKKLLVSEPPPEPPASIQWSPRTFQNSLNSPSRTSLPLWTGSGSPRTGRWGRVEEESMKIWRHQPPCLGTKHTFLQPPKKM